MKDLAMNSGFWNLEQQVVFLVECNVLVTSFSFVSVAKVVVPFRFVSAMFQT